MITREAWGPSTRTPSGDWRGLHQSIHRATDRSLFIRVVLAQVRGTMTPETSEGGVQELTHIPGKLEPDSHPRRGLRRTGENLCPRAGFPFPRTWHSLPIALEGALKLKEISYIPPKVIRPAR